MTSILSGAAYIGEITEFDGLQGYEFASPDKRVWVLWSPEQIDTQILVPGNLEKSYDKFGNEIGQEGNILLVNSPVYLQFTP